MKLIISFCLLLLSYPLCAEPKTWMKQSDPNSLGLFTWVSDECLFQQADLVNRIEGEFLRARLKPSKSLLLYLTINVRCMSVENKAGHTLGHVVSYEIRYGTKLPNGEYVLYESPDYTSMLVGSADSKQYFIDAIRDSISQSLTDYLKVNFQ